MDEKSREVKMRRWATRLGLTLHKSRARCWSIEDHQGYMLVNSSDYIEAGIKYDLTLDEVEAFLKRDEQVKRELPNL